MVADPLSTVWGVLFDLTDTDFDRLDECEGHPSVYRRTVETIGTDEGEVDAWIYTVVKKSGPYLPTEKYLGTIKAGAELFEFPREYRRFLAGLSTVESWI